MISKSRNIVIVILICLVSTAGSSQIYNKTVEAKIVLSENSEYTSIIASALNKTAYSQSLRFVLSIIKNDTILRNRSRSEQTGRIVLNSGESRSGISQTIINANETNRIIILLLIYDLKDNLLGKDRIVINGNEQDIADEKIVESKKPVLVDASHPTDDGIGLRDLMVEDTKTKPGRDFFRIIADLYRDKKFNTIFVVTIKETLALANTTKIDIIVGQKSVLQFFIRPNNEFLRQAADEGIKRIDRYLQQVRRDLLTVQRF